MLLRTILYHKMHAHRCFCLDDMTSTGTMDTVAVFVKYFPELKDVVNPSDITAPLFAKGLLTDDEKYHADNTMHSPGERMNKLLDAVRKAIQSDSTKMKIFIDILGTIAKYNALVDRMRRNLAGGKS